MRARTLAVVLLLSLPMILDRPPLVNAAMQASLSPVFTSPHSIDVLVPAYFYPVPGSPWVRLDDAARRYPGRITAIGDPFNGPGLAFDATYDATFKSFRMHGGRLLGYVYTSYGQRPLAQVLADIDQWIAWYTIDGVFVDEMDNVPGAHEAYYQAIYQYAQSKLNGHAPVVGNPGTTTTPGYLTFNGQPVASTVILFENSVGTTQWTAPAWTSAYTERRFAALAYKLGAADWKKAIDHAARQNCGMVFVTDDDLPNPWDTLPPYFETMVDYLAHAYP